MSSVEQKAKTALDALIRKARVHLYKPIQIAEILHVDRTKSGQIDLNNLSTYRNASKRWRDDISRRLVGNISTSSAKYQDDLFNDNAMPPHLLTILGQINRQNHGVIENYIYHQLKIRLQDVLDAYTYLTEATVTGFSLTTFLDFYQQRPGLKRSVDKAYEIVVYGLFALLVTELNATVSLTLHNPDPEILLDFEKFVESVLGVTSQQTVLTMPARLYRSGVANAADRGLDMWANFGLAVQVKHLGLSEELAENIASSVLADEIVVVCQTAEAKLIQSLLNQIGLRIRGVITQNDLVAWYNLCQTKYHDRMGPKLLENLRQEFRQEFPTLTELSPFMAERDYEVEQLVGEWQI